MPSSSFECTRSGMPARAPQIRLEEELARPIQGFRDQLSYPDPNAAFGAFLDGKLVGSAAVAWPSKLASSRHKVNMWGVFVAPSCRRLGIGKALVSTAHFTTACI